MATTRKDVHSPSNIDPTSYDYLGSYYVGDDDLMRNSPDYDRVLTVKVAEVVGADVPASGFGYGSLLNGPHTAEAGAGTCDHCGGWHFHGFVMAHRASGTAVAFGWQCGEMLEALPSKAAAERRRRTIDAKAAKSRNANLGHVLDAWAGEEAEMVAVLEWADEHADFVDLGWHTRTIMDIAGSFRRNRGSFASVKQRDFFYSLPQKGADTLAKKDADAERLKDAKPVPVTDERLRFEGVVISTKWQESDFGGSLKMLVETTDGFRLWGSVPSAIDVDKGDQVAFDAKVQRSDKDEHFGFFKRPTKAEVVATAAVEDDS